MAISTIVVTLPMMPAILRESLKQWMLHNELNTKLRKISGAIL